MTGIVLRRGGGASRSLSQGALGRRARRRHAKQASKRSQEGLAARGPKAGGRGAHQVTKSSMLRVTRKAGSVTAAAAGARRAGEGAGTMPGTAQALLGRARIARHWSLQPRSLLQPTCREGLPRGACRHPSSPRALLSRARRGQPPSRLLTRPGTWLRRPTCVGPHAHVPLLNEGAGLAQRLAHLQPHLQQQAGVQQFIVKPLPRRWLRPVGVAGQGRAPHQNAQGGRAAGMGRGRPPRRRAHHDHRQASPAEGRGGQLLQLDQALLGGDHAHVVQPVGGMVQDRRRETNVRSTRLCICTSMHAKHLRPSCVQAVHSGPDMGQQARLPPRQVFVKRPACHRLAAIPASAQPHAVLRV